MAITPVGFRDRSARAVTTGVTDFVERRLGLTPSGALIVVAALVCLYAGRKTSNTTVFVLGYALMFVVATALLLGRRRLALTADRSTLPRRVREGQLVEVELGLTAGRRITTILVEEWLPPALADAPVRLPVPVLPGGETVSHPYSFSPRRRGVYEVGPLVATWSDPFGLTKKRALLMEATEILVHPSTETVNDRVVSRAWEDPPIRPPVSRPWPIGFEFYGMQDYEPGDDPRRIVWRATARTLDPLTGEGRYLVRVAEQGITDRVLLLLDNNVRTHTPGAPSETFESAVRVIASVGNHHLTSGFAVSVETNDGRVVDSLRGARNRIPFLDALARVDTSPTPLASTLDRMIVNLRRDTHVLLVTPHVDSDAATRIRLLVNRGIHVLLVLILNDDSDPDSLHRAGALGTNVVEVKANDRLDVVFNRVLTAGGRR